ncbi:MAG TPA: hypothetical protein PL151_02540 [Phycisphaerae bacterium]|nr:hypothetical protein [Phycisphaerae bacterium]HOM52992.1 hypothetical protein [Phycisphaerae bacterium]HPP27159.1 hypothetical protein [Phycisphaerae bacterium]HQE26612.1 hypothetical protein [Phycisphaerae bacterium]
MKHLSMATSTCSVLVLLASTGLSLGDASTPPSGEFNVDDPTYQRLSAALREAGQPLDASGASLLPSGTVLDDVSVDEQQVGHVRITVPVGGTPLLIGESQAEAIDELLRAAFDVPLAGMSVSIRIGRGEYVPMGAYVSQAQPLPDAAPDLHADAPDKEDAIEPTDVDVRTAFGVPSAHADGQPVGALTGVVVYCSAGHGWTAGTSSWGLQRPLMHSMNEDYGNIDQLNLFANYCYNAGAVVVPYRPIGYQTTEIVLDNDDAGVTFTGSWISDTSVSVYYENGVVNSGVRSRRIAASTSETATARYTPNIPAADFYPVYCWTPYRTDGVPQTYRIRHSGGTAEVVIDHSRVGRGWIWLGNYYFEAGTGGYVEISNRSTVSGTVTADAIRFGNGMGNVVGAGPGRVSGYPREEEASRYWAESEAGINARGLPTSIWNCCSTDSDDNVGTAARWAREMNRIGGTTERWRRVYMEFHTNASSGSAKGTVALYNEGTAGTTHQLAFATLVGEKVEADMLALHNLFEYPWGVRNPNTYHASFAYGAISTGNNGNEFEATLLEIAYHDNAEDAANLRNVAVRDAVARSTVNAIIQFLSDASRFPGTQVPAVFPPDPPEQVRARSSGDGLVVVSWTPGASRPASPASGDPATGYKIYRSSNGYGFGNAITVGNVQSVALSDIPADETVYLRVTAINAGGESMPSPTMAVRRAVQGPSRVLIVDGFDRVTRQQNYVQTIPAGAMERQIARKVNSFDYAVQHATALAAADMSFDYATNEAIISRAVPLTDYRGLVWILGEEGVAHKTFDSVEQALVTNYLNAGGSLFVSGSEIGFELDYREAGRSFYENVLRANYVADASGTYNVIGSGGVFADVGAFNFSPAGGAPYAAEFADVIEPQPGAVSVLQYSTSPPRTAAIQYDSGTYRLIMLGFPFETIGSSDVRALLMQRAMSFLVPAGCPFAPDSISDFEGYANSTQVLFRLPRYSGTTVGHLLASPNVAGVSDAVPGFDGGKVYQVQWQWVDTHPTRWLRLTTSQAPFLPNPIIDLRRVLRVRLRVDEGSFRLALGVRETGVDGPIGSDGGSSGSIEWIGATSVVPDGGPQGVLVTAQPGVWQTITFAANSGNVIPFTGDGRLDAANGKVVLEHLAFSVVDTAGPITVYLDSIEQSCPLQMDFDGDGDVDLEDFGMLQACVNATGVVPTDPQCQNMSLDGDLDVDAADVQIFQRCLQGPGITADPACLD